MESVLRWLIHDGGLPMPELQFPVRDTGGIVVAAADMAWPEHKVLVEFDGDVHRERKTFVRDRRRQNRIVVAGWIVLRFTSADVYGDPQGVLSQIRRALGL
jgi:very-short-patch-repair endonuclease